MHCRSDRQYGFIQHHSRAVKRSIPRRSCSDNANMPEPVPSHIRNPLFPVMGGICFTLSSPTISLIYGTASLQNVSSVQVQGVWKTVISYSPFQPLHNDPPVPESVWSDGLPPPRPGCAVRYEAPPHRYNVDRGSSFCHAAGQGHRGGRICLPGCQKIHRLIELIHNHQRSTQSWGWELCPPFPFIFTINVSREEEFTPTAYPTRPVGSTDCT